jgi:hypothetical protein
MRRIAAMALITALSGSAVADVTGAGDTAIIAQLKAQTAKMVEQLKTVTETLDVSQRLEDMEQLRFVRRLSAEGEALRGVVSDVREGTELVNDARSNPGNLKDIDRQISRLEARMADSEDVGDYAHMLADLKRIRMLGQANRESMEKAATGTDEQEDIKSTAANAMIMADIMVQNESEEAQRRVEERKAMQELWQDNGYAELYKED